MTDPSALRARLEKAIAEIEQQDRGTTHWDGCEASHRRARD